MHGFSRTLPEHVSYCNKQPYRYVSCEMITEDIGGKYSDIVALETVQEVDYGMECRNTPYQQY